MWIVLMQQNQSNNTILQELTKYKTLSVPYTPHANTLNIASDANRDKIQKGWEYLVASIR